MDNVTKIKNALRAADLDYYESAWSATSKDLAQKQLSSRTHYVDDSTLRFFGAKINETSQDDNGLWFALRESVQPPHSARVHRWAIFDVFGTCVARTEERSNGAGADKLFPALIAATDWEAHTIAELERMADTKEREAAAIRTALEAVQ